MLIGVYDSIHSGMVYGSIHSGMTCDLIIMEILKKELEKRKKC